MALIPPKYPFSIPFGLFSSQLCISRQAVSIWLEKMILMNILGGCYLGTGLLGFACMRELVYWVLSVCRNMSTAVCLYGGTCPLLFYPSVRTCLLFHIHAPKSTICYSLSRFPFSYMSSPHHSRARQSS